MSNPKSRGDRKEQIEADYLYLSEEIKLEHNYGDIVGQSQSLQRIPVKTIKALKNYDWPGKSGNLEISSEAMDRINPANSRMSSRQVCGPMRTILKNRLPLSSLEEI